MRLVILLVLGAILFSLASGLFHLLSDSDGSSRKMVSALTWRIGLSVALFILLFVAWFLGVISPHDVGGGSL